MLVKTFGSAVSGINAGNITIEALEVAICDLQFITVIFAINYNFI